MYVNYVVEKVSLNKCKGTQVTRIKNSVVPW
jgi:hypothetical protein